MGNSEIQYEHNDTFQGLQTIVNRLMSPDGCPWDREQTHESLKRNLLEECYELIEAIESGSAESMAEELGDVVLQIAMHIRLAEESGSFATRDVFASINSKLIRRHPHVFGVEKATNKDEVRLIWESIKKKEKGNEENSTSSGSALGDILKIMPSLAYAQLIQDRASLSGFDWPSLKEVFDKLDEEIKEFQEAATRPEQSHELGDLIFSLVNISRWFGFHAESTLSKANQRFYRRFSYMESLCIQRELEFINLTLEEKETLWKTAKAVVG